ncbi:MAG: hypothetical protein ABI467_16600 [Kofleriaceae bacterium]
MRTALVVVAGVVAGCGASSPPANPPGPQGTWTCHQIVESCDLMCRTGMCLQACSNEGSPEGGSLHAALIQCAATHRCYDDGCKHALCGPEVEACLTDHEGLPPIATTSGPHPPPPHDDREAPHDREALPPPSPHDDPAREAAPELPTRAGVTGAWSYGSPTAVGAPSPGTGERQPGTGSGGTLRLASDGRFERATNVETQQGACKTEDLHLVAGTWKLEGTTLALSIEHAVASFRDRCHPANDFDRAGPAKQEHRAIRMTGPDELELTDDAGELQSYRKRS